MSAISDPEIMQHADGERELELDAQDRAKAATIGELGELVRGLLELAADDVPDQRFAAMWRDIDKEIDRAPAPIVDGFWRRLARWLETYRGYIITGAVSAGAVAALALVLRGSGDSGTPAGDHDPINARPVAHRPAEIESLDTPGGTGTIFHIDDPDDKDGSTTVIWVTPEDTVEGI